MPCAVCGAGVRCATQAFCAGGDVKTLWERGQRDETRHEAVAFFKREYLMNYMLATSNKNVSVWWCMGVWVSVWVYV